MRLRVVDSGTGILSVLIDGPIVSGDADHQLVTRLPQSGSADNDVTVTVDPKTNLLQKVEVTSTGQLTAIATNIAKSLAYLQTSNQELGITVFAGMYEIEDLPGAGNAANVALENYYRTVCRYRTTASLPFAAELKKLGESEDSDKSDVVARLKRCRAMAIGGADTAIAQRLIRITVGTPPAALPAPDRLGGGRAVAVDPDRPDVTRCRQGICYRPYTTRQVNLNVVGAFALSDTFLIPDRRALVMVDLPAGAFAVQKYTLDFTDGVLTKYHRDGKSELVGLAGLPVEIVKTILSAPVEALGLKQKKLEAQSSYLGALDKAVAQQETTAALCAKSKQRCPDTAYKLIGGKVTPDGGDTGRAGDSETPPVPAPTPTPSPTPSPANGGIPNGGG